MSENIELRKIMSVPDGDIEEYHEINHETRESSFISLTLSQHVNTYEFFTINVPQKPERKKRHKRKEKGSNLMDIISSELAITTVPIKKNVIETIDENNKHERSYLLKFNEYHNLFRRAFFDNKYGFSRNYKRLDLKPIFPRILENTSIDLVPNFSTEYLDPVMFDEFLGDTSKTNQQTKFLNIELNNIKFIHHHSYSLETLLCLKLIELFNKYEHLEKVLKDLYKDIKISRDTKNNIKRDLVKVSPSKREDVRFDETLRKYTLKLLQLKNKNRETIKLHQEVIHKVVSVWFDIEMIREKNNIRETPYNLIVKKDIVSKNDFEREWNETYEFEFMDMLDKIEFDFVTKYIDYKEVKKSHGANETDKKLSKPKLKIEEEKLKTEVEELVNNIVTRERIYLSLQKHSNDLNLKRNQYCFEIYVDDVFVCESEQYRSNDNFYNTRFDESFSVEIVDNEKITLVLIENKKKMAHVDVELSTIRNIDNDFTKIILKYSKDVDPDPDNVGSGFTIKEIATANKVRLKCSNTFKGKLTTACEVNTKIVWSDNIKENHSDIIIASMDIGHTLKRLMHGVVDPTIQSLTDMIGKVYGKDVSNDENIIKTVKELCKQKKKADDGFPIDVNSSEFVRLKLLHLRNSGGFTNVENKMIPIHGSQISTEHLNCLQKNKEKEFDIEYLKEKEADMDSIELQRFIAAKYIQKLNMKMLKNLNEHLMVKTQKDVVREFRDFSFRELFSRSPTNSSINIPNSTKQQLLSESLCKEQNIHITVVRAFNLLDRSTSLIEEGEDDNDLMEIAGYKVHPLRPFVRVSYHGVSAQTVTAIGCHPTWNHTLKISTKLDPLSSIHVNLYDESKVNISDGSDNQTNSIHYRYFNKWLGTVKIPIFTVLSLGTLRGTFKISSPPLLFGYETHQNKESNSLVPEIIQLMKKDISYISLHITTSLSHLGGLQAYNQPLPSTLEDDYLIKHLNNFVTDYLNDFPDRNISLTFIDSAGRNKCVTQFLQPIPLPSREHFPKNPKSCSSAMSKSSGVSRSSSGSGKRRDVDLEAGVEKETEYMSWKGDNLGRTINACLRYVALIPSYDVTKTHAVTLMGLELLKVLYGTNLDHTILLASYFLYLGIHCYIAIGLGMPRGRSSYVIIQYNGNTKRIVTSDQVVKRSFMRKPEGILWYVCDATAGERYELRDVGCPMKTVDYVFDNENIWLNVQTSQKCENVQFDFTKSSDWRPVFDTSIFVMKHPIVNDTSLYSAPTNMESLRAGLEAKIKLKVQKWRYLRKTIWNRYCGGLLKDALLYWEYWAFNPNENKPGFGQKLKQLMVTYKMSGFPLNMPFMSTKAILTAVKSTGLHVNDDPNVEFGLAVEVYAYPNNVLSVWVFFVSLSKI